METFTRIILRLRPVLCTVVLVLALPSLSLSAASEAPTKEYRLKAAFLVNFIRFISWPQETFSSDTEPFQLCIIGENPFGNELEKIRSKRFNNRGLEVAYSTDSADLTQCQMAFLSPEAKAFAHGMINELGHSKAVIVSDFPGFVDQGGSIEFVIQKDRLAFIINQSELEQRDIQVSASMLDLAAGLR